MSNRNDGYIPDDLLISKRPHLVEVSPPRDGIPVPRVPVTVGLEDEQNRRALSQWADVSGNGTHWSRFDGHHVQIDIELHTANRREVNAWKGRDEIRPEGTWTLSLARQQVWEGFLRRDPLDQLLEIRRIAQRLIDHDAIDWRDPKPAADQLIGRRVYYQRTPAIVSSVSVLKQGCVMLCPVGVGEFPQSVHALDRDENYDDERDEAKVELLSHDIWWWRNKPAGDEVDLRPVYDPSAERAAVAVPAEGS